MSLPKLFPYPKPNSKTDDLLSVFLNHNSKYQQIRQKAYQEYIQRYAQSKPSLNIFMSISQILTNLSKNVVLTGLSIILVLSTTTVIAAENLAPEEYKPSTIVENIFNPKDFESNQQDNQNPYTPLQPDDENDVAISEKCDLAIKYPKEFDGYEVYLYRGEPAFWNSYDEENQVYDGEYINFNVFQGYGKNNYYLLPTINCLNRDPMLEKYDDEIIIENPREFLIQNFGWYITQDKDIEFSITQNSVINSEYRITFQKDQKWYIISTPVGEYEVDWDTGNGNILKAIEGNQIQLQFSSLANNQSNAEIQDSSNSNSGLVSVDLISKGVYCEEDSNPERCNLFTADNADNYYVLPITEESLQEGFVINLEELKTNAKYTNQFRFNAKVSEVPVLFRKKKLSNPMTFTDINETEIQVEYEMELISSSTDYYPLGLELSAYGIIPRNWYNTQE